MKSMESSTPLQSDSSRVIKRQENFRSPMQLPQRPSLKQSGPGSRKVSSSIWADDKMSTFRLSKRSSIDDDKNSREGSADCLSLDDATLELIHNNEDSLQLSSATNLTLRLSSMKWEEENLPNDSIDNETSLFTNAMKLKRVRNACGTCVNSGFVQLIMSILIVANAVQLGAVTFDTVKENIKVSSILEMVDLGILSLFSVEVLLHFIYLGPALLQNGWLLFDTIVVLFSWAFMGSSLAILRSFRIFRIFSLVSRWESLRTLFEAVGSTIPKMTSIWVALMIVFYIFCVLYTTLYSALYDDGYLDQDYFGSLPKSFVTLFQIMTLDNWSNVARQVMDHNPASFVGFFAFIIFTAFFVVNLVVAVICETLIHVHRAEEIRSGALLNDLAVPPASVVTSGPSDILLLELLQNQHELQKAIQDLTFQLKQLRPLEQ